MASPYHQITEGEWVEPVHRKFSLQCCDCALVHDMDFRVVKGAVQFRVRKVNHRATAAARRPFKFKKERE